MAAGRLAPADDVFLIPPGRTCGNTELQCVNEHPHPTSVYVQLEQPWKLGEGAFGPLLQASCPGFLGQGQGEGEGPPALPSL